MKNMTLKNIAHACHGTLFYSQGGGQCYEITNKEVSGVVLDTRKVKENYLFLATKGEKVDGHDFIPQAIAAGAVGVICEKEPENISRPYILVEDSLKALKNIAEYYRKQLDIKVVGITGSVGKTSTKECIASVLSMKYQTLKTEGNFNNEVGLPLTILRIRSEHEVAVLEMGISDFGEMHRLSKMARPDICVITNIGQCHLENLKTREGVLRAKTEIFDFMQEDGFVCVNGDDDMLSSIGEIKGRKPISFGMDTKNNVYADDVVSNGLLGSNACIHIEDKNVDVMIPLPGEHMVYNALAAACVGNLLLLDANEIQKGIAAVKPVGGRSNIMSLEEMVVIDDCYNANPVSMCAALDLLSIATTRKVAILGDMFELGEDEKELHARVGAHAVEQGIDVIICIGELSRNMYDKACKNAEQTALPKDNIYYFLTRDEFMNQISQIVEKDDTILIKASHGMAFEVIVQKLQELN